MNVSSLWPHIITTTIPIGYSGSGTDYYIFIIVVVVVIALFLLL